jgi:hypothetical protein
MSTSSALAQSKHQTLASGLVMRPKGDYGENVFDLFVYSSQYIKGERPYDELLSRILCANGRPVVVLSGERNLAGRSNSREESDSTRVLTIAT